MKFADRKLASGFGAEAEVAGGDVVTDIPGHVGPPVVLGNQL